MLLQHNHQSNIAFLQENKNSYRPLSAPSDFAQGLDPVLLARINNLENRNISAAFGFVPRTAPRLVVPKASRITSLLEQKSPFRPHHIRQDSSPERGIITSALVWRPKRRRSASKIL